MADKEAGANCPAALVHAARTRSRLGGKVKRRFQEGAVDEVNNFAAVDWHGSDRCLAWKRLSVQVVRSRSYSLAALGQPLSPRSPHALLQRPACGSRI